MQTILLSSSGSIFGENGLCVLFHLLGLGFAPGDAQQFGIVVVDAYKVFVQRADSFLSYFQSPFVAFLGLGKLTLLAQAVGETVERCRQFRIFGVEALRLFYRQSKLTLGIGVLYPAPWRFEPYCCNVPTWLKSSYKLTNGIP